VANGTNWQRSIRRLYTEGMQEVSRIIGERESDTDWRGVALRTLDDLIAMMLAHTLETVQGRTPG